MIGVTQSAVTILKCNERVYGTIASPMAGAHAAEIALRYLVGRSELPGLQEPLAELGGVRRHHNERVGVVEDDEVRHPLELRTLGRDHPVVGLVEAEVVPAVAGDDPELDGGKRIETSLEG